MPARGDDLTDRHTWRKRGSLGKKSGMTRMRLAGHHVEEEYDAENGFWQDEDVDEALPSDEATLEQALYEEEPQEEDQAMEEACASCLDARRRLAEIKASRGFFLRSRLFPPQFPRMGKGKAKGSAKAPPKADRHLQVKVPPLQVKPPAVPSQPPAFAVVRLAIGLRSVPCRLNLPTHLGHPLHLPSASEILPTWPHPLTRIHLVA